MTRQNVEVLPVVDAGKLVGQISVTSLLRAQGQQTDPLTGLPWSTALRAWASAALAGGHEVTILFIDLDGFGRVNKALGHVAGDDILRSVAHLLSSLVDPATDLLCRYGGDEFAIATTRREDEARALVEQIQETAVLPIEMDGTRSNVTVSIGVAGGRRGEGRKQAHVPATVEDLLALASQASTAVKEAKGMSARAGPLAASVFRGIESPAEPARRMPGGVPGAVAEARMKLVDVAVHGSEGGCAVSVTLRLGSREGVGRATGPVRGRGIMFLVAEATLAAIRRTIGEQHTFVLEELTEVPTEKDNLIVAVLGTPLSGSKGFVGGARAADVNRAVTHAILDALNRPLARSLAGYLRDDTVS
jgi:diguanylate cyclase (GGDEF)-like protein